jgi:hypothetical protein
MMPRLSAMIVLLAATIPGFAIFAQTPPAKEEPEQKANAANSPSLAETLSWLKDRLETDGGDSYTQQNPTLGPIKFRHSYQTVSFSSCTVSWLSISTMSPGLPQRPYKDTMNLADIDPTNVKIAPYKSETGTVFQVLLATRDGKKSIKDETEAGTVMYAQINWIFMDSSIADRVGTAVAHAATLCAKEPF